MRDRGSNELDDEDAPRGRRDDRTASLVPLAVIGGVLGMVVAAFGTMAYLGYAEGTLPETERAAAENLALPLWAGITAEQQERVVAVVRAAAGVAV